MSVCVEKLEVPASRVIGNCYDLGRYGIVSLGSCIGDYACAYLFYDNPSLGSTVGNCQW